LEYLYARISNPVNATLKPKRVQGIGYIYDDDPALVKGFVFFDANGNKSYDPSIDYPLSGVNVTITDSSTTQAKTTDATGHYSAAVLLGDVTVKVIKNPHEVNVGDGYERVGRSVTLSAAFRTGINTVRHVPTSVVALLARSLQRHVRVCAQGEQLLDASMAVSEAPETSTGGCYQKEKATLIEELVRLRGGFCGPNP